MVSAISFGVFWRRALSTMAIMRSRKVSPGLTVTFTMIQSDSTRVPPVTAEKSPPLSRITGADSPVIALSSTEATPSITSPSAGTTSPASISTTAPFGQRLGEVGEQHREPEPERHHADEGGVLTAREDEAGRRFTLAAERLH